MACDHCNGGDGNCVYPYYGTAPHECFYKIGASVGGSRELPESEWPANFVLDPDSGPATGYPRNGIWTHCLHCGDGSKPARD